MGTEKQPEIPALYWRNREGDVVPMLPFSGTCPDHPGVAEMQENGHVVVRGAAAVTWDGCAVDGCHHNRKASA